MSLLDRVKNEKSNILRAELIGYLHDIRKFCDDFIDEKVNLNQRNSGCKAAYNYSKFIRKLKNMDDDFSNINDDLLEELNTLKRIAHSEAHIEKRTPLSNGETNPLNKLFLSTIFGYENEINYYSNYIKIDCIFCKLGNLIRSMPSYYNDPDKYYEFRDFLRRLLSEGVGDTQRPLNEVSLWDWGFLVGTLMKSAYVWKILNNRTINFPSWIEKQVKYKFDIYWKFLSIKFNGSRFIFSSSKMIDIISRQRILDNMLNNIKELIEFEYPIGNEVYRDENTSLFIIPGNLHSSFYDDFKKKIIDKISNTTLLNGELIPEIKITDDDFQFTKVDFMLTKNYLEIIKQNVSDSNIIRNIDNILFKINNDDLNDIQFCLRNLYNDIENIHIDIINKLKNKIKYDNPNFVSEIETYDKYLIDALKNNVLNKIDLKISSSDIKNNICYVCNLRSIGPSPKAIDRNVCDICEARRMDRVKEWLSLQTEQTIWLDETSDENKRCALVVGKFDLTNWINGKYIKTLFMHLYDDIFIEKEPSFMRIYRIWNTTKDFWKNIVNTHIMNYYMHKKAYVRYSIKATIINKNDDIVETHTYELKVNNSYIPVVCIKSNNEVKFILIDNYDTVNNIKNTISNTENYELYIPSSYGKKREKIADIKIKEIKQFGKEYIPIIEVMVEPQKFMIIVPAKDALSITQIIKRRFEIEFGKVRNRMPFNLGIVYFNRKQPIYTVIDAGIRILSQKFDKELIDLRIDDVPKDVKQYFNFLNKNEENLFEDCKKITSNGRLLTYYLPLNMASEDRSDPSNITKDIWYIRFYNKNDELIDQNNLNNGEYYLEPNKFTYIFLDSAFKRFNIRKDSFYEIELIDRLIKIWNNIKSAVNDHKISKTKLHQVIQDLHTKKEIFDQDVFENYAKSVIVNEDLNIDIEDITSGRLFNAYEIFHYINKEEL